MSAENLRRIADAFASKLAGLDSVPDPMGILSGLVTELARDNAEFVFLKIRSEPGWTAEASQELIDQVYHRHALAITDVLHTHGGTVEMAQTLAQVAATVYGGRLAELSASYNQGGRA